MGVYIKGMEMPTSCPCEIIGKGYDLYCNFTYGVPTRVREYDECCETKTRPNWCPLVPVPAHRDLIERKAAYLTDFEIVMCDGDYKAGMKMLLDKINFAPTIIEAEEDE